MSYKACLYAVNVQSLVLCTSSSPIFKLAIVILRAETFRLNTKCLTFFLLISQKLIQ